MGNVAIIDPKNARITSTLSPLTPTPSVNGKGERSAVADTSYPTLDALLTAVRGCRACEAHLPFRPRPVVRASEMAHVLVVGQAPGVRAHATGIPWDDASGERLRAWMGVDKNV